MDESWSEKLAQYNTIFSEILDTGALSTIYESMKWMGFVIILAMSLYAAWKTVASGGTEAIDPGKDVALPILYALVLVFWLDILAILDVAIGYIAASINEGVKVGNATGLSKFNEMMDALMAKSNAKTLAEKLITLDVSSVFPIHKWVLEMLYGLGQFLDNVALTFFYGFSQTILMLLKITGIIAVVLSFTGKFSSFITWLKNYISVQLWMVMAYMVFYIVDQLYLVYLEQENIVLENIPDAALLGLTGHQIFVFIAFGILKLVLMFKIPHIVSMFIGSSSGGGSMFGVMFAPVKIGADGAKAAISGGQSLMSKFKK